ncbi:MAG: FAD-dependent oxidoreductase, partial [Burkholderiales bacterium]
SYGPEREYAADENILNSTRSTDFITPKSDISRLFRDAALQLSKDHPFARHIVNSGRLSMPAVLRDSPLNTPDADQFAGAMEPGAAAADAPLALDGKPSWLLSFLGADFTLLCFGDAPAWAEQVDAKLVTVGAKGLADPEGLAARRYDAKPGSAYLIRPDQHICARWRQPTASAVRAAIDKACART